MRSIYLSRSYYNRELYKAFKQAYNTLYRYCNDIELYHARFYQETGCRISKLRHNDHGDFRSVVIEFDRDKDYTMFLLRWS